MPGDNPGGDFAVVLVDELVRHGVRHAVIAPGSRSTQVALALLRDGRITVHVRVDERSAAYLALGIAKASEGSDAIVPVLCTSGTATAHFHAAVMEADLSRVPLLVLTADRPPELHGIGSNQTVEQVGMYGGAVRWSFDVGVPENRPDSERYWRSVVSQAAAHLLGTTSGMPGPVHLNLALREPLTPPGARSRPAAGDGNGRSDEHDRYRADYLQKAGGARWKASAPPRHGIPRELARRLSRVRRGVVVAGDCFDIWGSSAARFAERVGWPLIAEPHSQERVGPLALRATDALLRDDAFTAAHRPDLVVVIGRVGLSRRLLDWLATVPHVVISADGGWWDVTRTAEAVFRCEGRSLDDAEIVPADPQWAAAWLDASTRTAAAIDDLLDSSPTLTEPRVARDVADLVPDSGALVVGSSMPIRDLDLVMRPRTRNVRIFANRGASGIDGFVSTAQGVAIGHPFDGPTVALCGDLSLLHDVNGLMPGPDARPDITYVVVNNNGGGIFSVLPQAEATDPAAFERLFGTPHGMSLERVAAAYDIDHTLARTAENLAAALSSFGGVRMVEVRTDRADNAALHARLREIRATAR
jgi:2-succinyl-5-enolpyruvyl-6-hydroxy-3-cyclohexene-1-carboxylate synthase